jgi:pyridoxal 5'-phosphate synthase pdxT subunit
VPVVGVLALQGDFEAHARLLAGLGAEARAVRELADLDDLDALVIPGGESTTMTLGIEREGLAEPVRDLVRGGTPVLGTCAGLIMLDRDHLDVLDLVAERNAFGRQVASFEEELELALGAGAGAQSVRAVFIRAPLVAEHGEDVDVLASVDGRPVAVRQGDVLAVAFHPELAGEDRLHRWLLERAQARRAGIAAGASASEGTPSESTQRGERAPVHTRGGDPAARLQASPPAPKAA